MESNTDRLAACKASIRELVQPNVLLRVLLATLERRGFTLDKVDAGLRAVNDETEIFSRKYDHPRIRYEEELSLTPFEQSSGKSLPEDSPPADPRPKDATAKELRRLVNAMAIILELQDPTGCPRFVVEEQLKAAAFADEEIAWAMAVAEDYELSEVDDYQCQPDFKADVLSDGESPGLPTDVLVSLVERYCPPLPWIRRSQIYSAVRRMQAEKELGIPVCQRSSRLLSVKDGKRANELPEQEWEALFERLCNQLQEDYPEEYARLFC